MVKNNLFKKKCIIAMLVFVCIFSMGCDSKNKVDKVHNEALKVAEGHKLYKSFKEMFPSCEPITCKAGDVTNDGKEDLIMIYRSSEKVRMRVLIDGPSVAVTDEVPAPIENQTIELKDIDNKDEIEFIVSGSKRGNIGYAIYRIVNNNIKDLFGQDMDQCC
ncbi:hypothetical protein SAMN02745248_01820 [Hathewaya proteolytica DSM 3090]|uniref:Lipoprotein n=1 Tax=Hathewaya proteolytica DSM 3090 TaxID=1121331 RepID=A0A1M6PVA9_9CLOT|nr:Cys-Cys-COOH (seleno)protein SaoC [Hathewaya proteolytica]SHK11790.1 hypothetical protein SAMN02745248_01820 [Hathewaya proteolytica DSM 3090]